MREIKKLDSRLKCTNSPEYSGLFLVINAGL